MIATDNSTQPSPALATLIHRYFHNPELRSLAHRVIDPHPFSSSPLRTPQHPNATQRDTLKPPRVEHNLTQHEDRPLLLVTEEDVDQWGDLDVTSPAEGVTSPMLLKFRRETENTGKVVGKMVFNSEEQRWENTAQEDENDFMAGFSESDSASLSLEEEGDEEGQEAGRRRTVAKKKDVGLDLDVDLDHHRQLDGDPFELTEEERAGFRLSEQLHNEQMAPVEPFQPMDTETLLQLTLEKLVLDAQTTGPKQRQDSQRGASRRPSGGSATTKKSARAVRRAGKSSRKPSTSTSRRAAKPPWL